MSAPASPAAPEPAEPDELRVLFARLRAPEDRPLPTEEEAAAFAPVDPGYDAAIGDHLEPHLGGSSSRSGDTECPFAIDVAHVEPGGPRRWGALFTVGAGAVAVPGEDAEADRPPVRRFELIARLPESSFRYWDGVVLEPFDEVRDAVVDALGELARLPHLRGVRYCPPQIVATPDLTPLAEGLPFAGALLRDAREAKFGAAHPARHGPAPLAVPGFGEVAFLTVTFLHASEIRALLGPGRRPAMARLEAAGVDELVKVARRPVM